MVSGASVQKGFSAMNFRMLAASVRPRGRVFALLAATALVASLVALDVRAQQPAPAPAPAAPPPAAQAAPPPAAAPAAGAPAAGGQAPEQQVQLIYSPWTKFCVKGQESAAQ